MNLTDIQKKTVIFSPIIMVAACHIAARVGSIYMGKWAFIPVMLTIWIVAFIFLYLFADKQLYKNWLAKTKGHIGIKFLVVLIGLLPLPIFLLHWRTIDSATILIPYVILALVNPFFEEFYWRGLLLEYTRSWATWQSVIYTSFFFAINHPLSFGMFSVLNGGYTVFASTFIMGIIWAIGYQKIGNLRLIIFSHFLIDVLNLSVPAFLDLFKNPW